VISVAIHYRHW